MITYKAQENTRKMEDRFDLTKTLLAKWPPNVNKAQPRRKKL